MGKVYQILIFTFFLLLSYHTYAQQDRSSLENQRKELNRQIESTAKNLEKTALIRKQEAEKLAALQEKVKSRSKQLSGIRGELNTISDKIEYNTEKITEHAVELDIIKIAYKKILLLLYRNKALFSLFDLLFAPDRFREQYIRLYYLKKLQKKYYQSALKLSKEQEQMTEEIASLTSKKEENKQKLKTSKEQGGSLNDELEKQEKQFRELNSKEKKLKKELAVQEDSKRKLNLKIEQLIKEQIASSKSNSRSYESAKNRKNFTGVYISNDNTETGGSFASKKGKLPKPLKGAIVSGFGKQQHPIFEQVFTYNNGIDIKASSALAVRAVHDGSVVSVFAVPGNGNAVMLKHGEYYSAYSNLESVSVKRGDKLKSGAQLGIVGKDSNTGSYLLHFEIWEGKNKEDPEDWLK
jgi:septal ring factor EnvC (AmiA/AmiB activator)